MVKSFDFAMVFRLFPTYQWYLCLNVTLRFEVETVSDVMP